jgi:hypothetical protein
MTKELEHNEICTWCETELSDYDEVYYDIEGNPYCCESHLDSAVAVRNTVRNHSFEE